MPETTNYMILGYAVTIIILAALVVYLVVKARNLRAELKMLETMEEDPSQSDSLANANTSAPRDAALR